MTPPPDERRHLSRIRLISLLPLGAALAAATMVEPGWPAHFGNSLLWLAGAWRALLLPAAVTAVFMALVTNQLQPRRAWSTNASIAAWAVRRAPAAIALALG